MSPYSITSDAGWGCMLRASQMLMARALQVHYLGRDWRRGDDIAALRSNKKYTEILRLFCDYPGPPHVYALHHLVQGGITYDKLPGEWFGPSTAALVLRDLSRLHHRKYGGQLEVLVTQGDTIYISDVEKLCTGAGAGSSSDSEISPGSDIASQTQAAPASEGTESQSNECVDDSSSSSVLFGSGDGAQPKESELPQPPTGSEENEANDHNKIPESVLPSVAVAASSAMAEPAPLQPPTTANKTGGDTDNSFFDPLLNPAPVLKEPWKCSLMVCVPLRLGITSVSKEYIEALKSALRSKYCLGFIGGRENHAIYFVGYQQVVSDAATGGINNLTLGGSFYGGLGSGSSSGSAGGAGSDGRDISTYLLGLDPHTVYPNIPQEDPFPTKDVIAQLHVDKLESLHVSRLDPSLSLAFYFRDREEFEGFCEETRAAEEQRKASSAAREADSTANNVTAGKSNSSSNSTSRSSRGSSAPQAPPPPPPALYYVQHAAPASDYCGGADWGDNDDDDGDGQGLGKGIGAGKSGAGGRGGMIGPCDDDDDDEYVLL
jgi:Peptidase family C54